MQHPLAKYFITILLVIVGGLLQRLGVGIVFGIRPNIVLAIMIAVACVGIDFGWYLVLMAASYVVLKNDVWWDWPAALMILESLTIYLIARFAPWRPLVTIVIIAVLATASFYAILAWPTLTHQPMLFIGEALYTIIVTVALYKIFNDLDWIIL